jgi:hypothetical protein
MVLRDKCSEASGIFYALGPDGRIVHISDAPRGSQCGCTCVACGARLIAKQGKIKIPHFSHAAYTACGGGAETALHRLAKQVISDNLKLRLPEMRAEYDGEIRILRPAQIIEFDRAEIEKALVADSTLSRGSLIPDMFLWKGDRRLMVEIYVTHPCDENKLARLRQQDIAAIEIDLSRLPRNVSPAEFEEAVISGAARRWVFHRDIHAVVREMEAEAELAKKQKEEKQRKAAKKFQTEVDSRAQEYLSGVAEIDAAPIDIAHVAVPAQLTVYVGMKVDGYGCFTVPPAVWQSAVLNALLKDTYGSGRRIVQMREIIQENGLIRPEFRYVSKECEAALESRQIGFKSPYGAIETYLKALLPSGILSNLRSTYYLKNTVVEQVRREREANQRRRHRMQDVRERVRTLVQQLPVEDAVGFNLESWIRSQSDKHAMSVAGAIEADGDEIRKILLTLSSIEKMVFNGDCVVDETLGLPVEKQRELVREHIRVTEEQREAQRLKIEEEERQDRLSKLIEAANELLPPHDAQIWLNTPAINLGDMTPAAYVQERPSSLRIALQELSWEADRREHAIELKRKQEQERISRLEEARQKLIHAASQELGVERGRVFCDSAHPKLGSIRPIDYCKDAVTLQTCIALFQKNQKRRNR